MPQWIGHMCICNKQELSIAPSYIAMHKKLFKTVDIRFTFCENIE